MVLSNQSVLIEHGTIFTLDDNGTVLQPGYLRVEGDKIASMGPGEASADLRTSSDTILDARDMAVIPGMVNAHTHLFQTFIRGLADDKPLLDWLRTCIWPVAGHMDSQESRLAGLVGFLENLRSGATAVIDHQYIHADLHNDDSFIQAAQDVGLRLLLARGWTDTNYSPMFLESPDQIIAETARLHETYHGSANGRIRIEFGPLIPWGCTDETMLRTHALAKEWGVGTHIHVAETKGEVDTNLETRGDRHVEWLARTGILGPDVQLVHSVYLDDHELDLVAESGAVVVHCPISNMYLASGAARIDAMRQRGIPIALGTDGPGSNNNQDMFELLKTTALLAKVSTLDANVILPEDVVRMACRGGALAFGLPDLIGVLEVGRKADIVLIDLQSPFAVPVHNPLSAIVYCLNSGAVHTVLVDGQILMRDKKVLVVDEESVLKEARSACRGLMKRAGISSGLA
jgi:5-methylthioadenosine/S-adenosylhomocysteine deaminase